MALYSPIRATDRYDRQIIDEISKNLSITETAAKLMVNRGIDNIDDAYSYIFPDMKDLEDPFELADMDKAVERIRRAVESEQKIIIYGDYDVDGVTASAILYLYLKDLGSNVDVYIPHRYREGYGLNMAAIETLNMQGTNLLITVDCGITSFDEIERARELGMDVIVTDHHNIGQNLPPATAVVNPKRSENSNQDGLAGVGVAAKLICAMGGVDALREFLDLVAIGTIADIVPLLGENRIFTALGLRYINSNPRLGIRALAEVSGLDYKKITSQDIAFGLAPRLNAAGRMDSALDAFRLLTAEDPKTANDLALKLNTVNRERQDQEATILEQAQTRIDSSLDGRDRIIVLEGREWHAGIIGIAASKLVEIYRRPVILLTNVEDGLYTGSARSIDGFDIYKALYSTRHILERFGGHKQAAGITIRAENIPMLKDNLKTYSRDRISRDMLIPKYKYDVELCNEDITFDLYNDLQKLEPFGLANPVPTFLLREAYIDSFRLVGKMQNHVKLSVGIKGRLWEGIWFNGGDSKDSLDMKPCTTMLVNLDKNEWNGLTNLQLNIKSLKIQADSSEHLKKIIDIFYFKFFDDFYHNFLYNRDSSQRVDWSLDRIDVSKRIDRDKMFEVIKRSAGGNIILLGDAQIATELLTSLLEADIIDDIEVGYGDLIHRNGRGVNGLVILPRIPQNRLNEYENIFIISGDSFLEPSRLPSFNGQLWLVEDSFGCSKIQDFLLTRDDFVDVYIWLKQTAYRQRVWDHIEVMLSEFNVFAKQTLNYFQFRLIIEIFKELCFLRCDITEGHVIAQLNAKPESKELHESSLYRYYKSWLLKNKMDISSHDFKEVN